MNEQKQGVTALGAIISALLVVGLVALGVYMIRRHANAPPAAGTAASDRAGGERGASSVDVMDAKVEVPRLSPPGTVQISNNVIPVEISEYAGYAGLIAANGGLEPSENSVFFKNYGVKVKLTISEGENWSALNEGKIAASVTTADVLAVYGRQLHAMTPVQIGYSRGADGLVVRKDITRINALKGKVIATAQFTEVDFLIRYLAQEAGLPVNALSSLDSAPRPDRVNVVYTEDGFAAGDLFAQELKSGKNRLAGCVTWEPKVSEIVAGSNGQAHVLTTNRNLLIIADVLIVHRTFAEQQPKMVEALVRGVLEGNRMVRDQPEMYYDVVGRAFKWSREKTRDELGHVHLANLPENLAFYSGRIDDAGSFGGIYQSAVLAYGSDLIPNPPSAERFIDVHALQAMEKSGLFKEQKIAIAPIRGGGGGPAVETNPLLSKDIRFLFQPNTAMLDLSDQGNLQSLDDIRKLLQVSPGSTLLLRGHVDNALVPEFRRKGGDAEVRAQALRAMELSQQRADEIKRLLVEKQHVDPKRLDAVGRGWEEPAGTDSAQNRRVEVQWFTLE
jgi:NitT/TauT family transport system substrate-binding protein